MAADEKDVTVIGHSAIFRGELSGDCDVRIDGTLEGSVSLPNARVMVGPDANVRALLTAKEITVHGRVEGDLRTTGLTSIRATATVTGNVWAARLWVEDEAVLHGQVDSTPASGAPAEPVRVDPDAAEPASVAKAPAAAVPPAASGGVDQLATAAMDGSRVITAATSGLPAGRSASREGQP